MSPRKTSTPKNIAAYHYRGRVQSVTSYNVSSHFPKIFVKLQGLPAMGIIFLLWEGVIFLILILEPHELQA